MYNKLLDLYLHLDQDIINSGGVSASKKIECYIYIKSKFYTIE